MVVQLGFLIQRSALHDVSGVIILQSFAQPQNLVLQKV